MPLHRPIWQLHTPGYGLLALLNTHHEMRLSLGWKSLVQITVFCHLILKSEAECLFTRMREQSFNPSTQSQE